MSVATADTDESLTGPTTDCGDCQNHLIDETILDATGDEAVLLDPGAEDTTDTDEAEDLSAAQRGARALGIDSAELDGMAELQQANGKRVVKVLASVGIGVVILNEIFSIGALANSSGPFGGVISSIETTGVAALTLLVVGLVAYAGAVAMGYLDMF